MSLNLFIIGPSGCGKSTQAKLIAQKYQLAHLSAGQLLRDEIESASKMGLEIKAIIDSGNLAPDDVIHALLVQKLQTIDNQNFILDGFPRRLDQGIYIEKYLANKGHPIDSIIHLDLTVEDIRARRAKAGTSFQNEDTRSDNTPEAILARQKFYDDNNQPIMDYFKSKQKLINVDANRPIEPIFDDIVSKLDALTSK